MSAEGTSALLPLFAPYFGEASPVHRTGRPRFDVEDLGRAATGEPRLAAITLRLAEVGSLSVYLYTCIPVYVQEQAGKMLPSRMQRNANSAHASITPAFM